MDESYLSPTLWKLLDTHKREMTRYLNSNWEVSRDAAIHLMDGLLEEILTWSKLNFLVSSDWIQPALMRRGVDSVILRESSAITKELWIIAISKLPAISAQIYRESMENIHGSSVYLKHISNDKIKPLMVRDCDSTLPASCAALVGSPSLYEINQGRYANPSKPHFLDRVSYAALERNAKLHSCSLLAVFIQEVVHQYLDDITSENTLRWMRMLANSRHDLTMLPLLNHPVFESFRSALAAESAYLLRNHVTGTA